MQDADGKKELLKKTLNKRRGGTTPLPRRAQPLLLLFRSYPPQRGGYSIWEIGNSRFWSGLVLVVQIRVALSNQVDESI